jgi:RNA polymerase sigma-70 factor (ECF subfamily)
VEPSAFALLMRRHNRVLYRAARAILRDDAAAEDALQEAWLRAYHAIDAFRGESKLSTWLVRIVVNEALARRRKDQRYVAIGEDTQKATLRTRFFRARAQLRDALS